MNQLVRNVSKIPILLTGIISGCYLTPEPPAIMRDMSMVDEKGFTNPIVPALRTSADGRVGFTPQGEDSQRNKVRIYLMVPEKVTGTIMDGQRDASILADKVPYASEETRSQEGYDLRDGFDLEIPLIVNNPTDGRQQYNGDHATVCDVRSKFLPAGAKANPYSCGENGARDCYDLTYMTGARTHDGVNPEPVSRLISVDIRVEVSNPKTSAASISDVEILEGTEKLGHPVLGSGFFEPMTTADGQLIVGRTLQSPYILSSWENPTTGKAHHAAFDVMYSVMSEDASPCDVTNWEQFHPISHAYYDDDMQRYGFAKFPLRDSLGNIVPDGAETGMSYPWMDRLGNNIFFASTARFAKNLPYPYHCVEACDDYRMQLESATVRGNGVVGLWTQGKMVVMDNLVNHTDFQVGMTPSEHVMMSLYKDENDTPVKVRVGGGRGIDYYEDGAPAGYTGNNTIVDSVENLFNFNNNLKPVTPRDVVWLVSDGVSTDEFAFDDYMDVDGFIVSNMAGAISANQGLKVSMFFHDGYDGPLESMFGFFPWKIQQPVVQNAASALPDRWSIPKGGEVTGDGRLEPVAMGGIKGRGYWMDGSNGLKYTIEEQPSDIRDHDWYVSLFVDSRVENDDEERVLIRFPNNSALTLSGSRELHYVRKNGSHAHTITLPNPMQKKQWHHIGLALRDQNKSITLMLDGFEYDVFHSSMPMFEMLPGELQIGKSDSEGAIDWIFNEAGFKGWIDEFKVLAHIPSLEVMCNHAHGTLISIEDNDYWQSQADQYPLSAHAGIEHALMMNGKDTETGLFSCYHDYSGDFRAHLQNIPVGTTGWRDDLLFAEGPLTFNKPRPDSSDNQFCLTCHSSKGQQGLSIQALIINDDLNAELDPRRQPLQPLPRVFGNIPEGWLGENKPSEHKVSEQGELIDQWLLKQDL